MLFVSENGLRMIRECEGFAPTLYICPAGRPTIGYGHVVAANEDFMQKKITRDEAESLLLRDVAEAENAVNRLIVAKLTQNQFDALVCFTFNLGAAALARSTLRKCLNAADFAQAPKEIRRWVYGGGKVLEGLVRRRAAEATLFEKQ